MNFSPAMMVTVQGCGLVAKLEHAAVSACIRKWRPGRQSQRSEYSQNVVFHGRWLRGFEEIGLLVAKTHHGISVHSGAACGQGVPEAGVLTCCDSS